jgi:hypothetical protein
MMAIKKNKEGRNPMRKREDDEDSESKMVEV